MDMIKNLWIKYKEYILYLAFGVFTTVVNYLVYVPLTLWLHVPELIANAIAWVVAVAFAYITNRIWVFESKTKGFGPVVFEIFKFALGRVVSLLVEEAIIGIFVTWLGFNGLVIKVIASIVTIILNYIFSKFIIFKSKTKDGSEEELVNEDE